MFIKPSDSFAVKFNAFSLPSFSNLALVTGPANQQLLQQHQLAL